MGYNSTPPYNLTVTTTGGDGVNLNTVDDLKISFDVVETKTVATDFEFGLDGLPIVTDRTDISGHWNGR